MQERNLLADYNVSVKKRKYVEEGNLEHVMARNMSSQVATRTMPQVGVCALFFGSVSEKARK